MGTFIRRNIYETSKNRVDNGLYNYREFILSIISVTQQINDTAIMYSCM